MLLFFRPLKNRPLKKDSYTLLTTLLKPYGITTEMDKDTWHVYTGEQSLRFYLRDEMPSETEDYPIIYRDILFHSPEKIVALIFSKLKLNKSIYARTCTVNRVDKETAHNFLTKYHLMNATQSALNLGLFHKDELVSLATFSKGRKMNRLREDQRSFELIRFCCISGVTVTGGLSKLIKTFCEEKNAGDVMTYVDKHLSDGSSFIRAGFKKHSETEPNYFLVNRKTFERKSASKDEVFDKEKFYLSKNGGSIKLVYTPAANVK